MRIFVTSTRYLKLCEFSNFFSAKKYIQSNQTDTHFPISDEISKIFTGVVSSATVLRSLVAAKSKKPHLASWKQQDITEFYRALLDVLAGEFERNNCDAGRSLISQFYGSENLSFEFAEVCSVCDYRPDDKSEEFNILSLDVTSCADDDKLSEIIQKHFETPDLREMKCKCPHSNNEEIRVTSNITQPPKFLLIELRRYKIIAGDQVKVQQRLVLDEVLKNISGEDYKILAVVNHKGNTIQSGHYVTNVLADDNNWYHVDDDTALFTIWQLVPNFNNVLLFYSKIEAGMLIESADQDLNKLTENLENVKVTKPAKSTQEEKVPCLGCNKKYVNIFPHIKGNQKGCRRMYDFEEEKRKYNLKRADIQRKSRERSKEDNPEELAKKERDQFNERRDKKKKENPETLAQKERDQINERRQREKEENPEKFAQKLRDQINERRQREKEEDPDKFAQKTREQFNVRRDKKKEQDPEGLALKEREQFNVRRDTMKEEDPAGLAQREKKKREKKKNKPKTDEEIIAKFHERVRDGPVFPCVCCTRVMFKHQVVIYEKEIQKTIESHDGLFEATIEGLDIHCPLIRGKHYLCKYCWRYLRKGEMSPISWKNDLDFVRVGAVIDIEDDDGNVIEKYSMTQEDVDALDLNELEQSLIARSLIFLKVYFLPKSRMGCVSDKIVYVPINENDNLNTINTILRTPSEAGILPVQIKRKIEYKNFHREEFISVAKVIAALKVLVKLRNPFYTFITDDMLREYEQILLDEAKKGEIEENE